MSDVINNALGKILYKGVHPAHKGNHPHGKSCGMKGCEYMHKTVCRLPHKEKCPYMG